MKAKSEQRRARELAFRAILDRYADRVPDTLMWSTTDFSLSNLSAGQLEACLKVLCEEPKNG